MFGGDKWGNYKQIPRDILKRWQIILSKNTSCPMAFGDSVIHQSACAVSLLSSERGWASDSSVIADKQWKWPSLTSWQDFRATSSHHMHWESHTSPQLPHIWWLSGSHAVRKPHTETEDTKRERSPASTASLHARPGETQSHTETLAISCPAEVGKHNKELHWAHWCPGRFLFLTELPQEKEVQRQPCFALFANSVV